MTSTLASARRWIQAALVVPVFAACSSSGHAPAGPAPAPRPPIDELADWMTGAFSSAAQAAERPEDFLDIRLFMAPIWRSRDDGPWLYVEQAAASALGQPYRQRVYHLVVEPDGIRSDVYELPGDPLTFAGAWRDTARFDDVTPDALVARGGCSIHLQRRGDAWGGSTAGTGCVSTLRGAAYATSVVTITDSLLTSWDRGHTADGTQVWGATAGPYEFVKQPQS